LQLTLAARMSLRSSKTPTGSLMRESMLRLLTCFFRPAKQPANEFSRALRLIGAALFFAKFLLILHVKS
jgi:hypothetical protein